ncbi:hypothetical protein [Membranihabitans maritimus]|uniref:hypothetical protein n=1 Tax=Membranihabitans maritimus TaxID=2904244 RepID=UPI001F2E27A9|nr:hypothetical protein [Membranihabitans maritimus]
MVIKNLVFYIKLNDRGQYYFDFWFEPSNWSKVLSGWALEYTTVENVNRLLGEIKQLSNRELTKNAMITSNESHIYIQERDEVTFDMELVTELKPVTLPIEDTLFLFRKYRDWLERYENCQIPGLIPESKLDTWSCVPNEYVKPEYWEKVKKEREDGEEV